MHPGSDLGPLRLLTGSQRSHIVSSVPNGKWRKISGRWRPGGSCGRRVDAERFDDLTRSVAGISRRNALRLLAGGGLGGLATLLDRDGAAACRRIRRACTRDNQCCSGRCDPQRGRCQGSCRNGQKLCNGRCIANASPCGAVPSPTVLPPPPSGLIPCGGVQIDPQTDEANCGACGRACPPGARCLEGECFCPAGTSRCPGIDRCVDLLTDQQDCGACNRPCLSGQTCTDGRCQTAVCLNADTRGVCPADPNDDPVGLSCSSTNFDCICATGADGGTACVIPDPVAFFPCQTNADCAEDCGCGSTGPFACIDCGLGPKFCVELCSG